MRDNPKGNKIIRHRSSDWLKWAPLSFWSSCPGWTQNRTILRSWAPSIVWAGRGLSTPCLSSSSDWYRNWFPPSPACPYRNLSWSSLSPRRRNYQGWGKSNSIQNSHLWAWKTALIAAACCRYSRVPGSRSCCCWWSSYCGFDRDTLHRWANTFEMPGHDLKIIPVIWVIGAGLIISTAWRLAFLYVPQHFGRFDFVIFIEGAVHVLLKVRVRIHQYIIA